MRTGTGTYKDVIDWTPYEGVPGVRWRVRKGPDGTVAFWHCQVPGFGYVLTHHCPDGRTITVGPERRANDVRRVMEAARK